MPSLPDDPQQDQSPAQASPNQVSPKKTRLRVDWTRGARLLGRGESPEAVAAALGVAEERLWRHLKSSRRFRRLLDETLGLRRFSAELQAILPADPRP